LIAMVRSMSATTEIIEYKNFKFSIIAVSILFIHNHYQLTEFMLWHTAHSLPERVTYMKRI
jgi:hypothetical protein